MHLPPLRPSGFATAIVFAALLPARADELIPEGATWRYLKGTEAPPANWNTPGFDHGDWESGPAGIGYDDGDDATELLDMENGYLTVYARRTFTVVPGDVTTLALRIRYDDGFVAYLNGFEVARRGLGDAGDPVFFDTPAGGHEATGFETINLGSSIGLLVNGTNLLAIELHNTAIDSSDASLHPNLLSNVPISTGPWPPGFEQEVVASGFQTPVGIAVADDGRIFVAEKRGMIRVIEDGAVLPTPVLDITGEVNNAGDRGLLGIELDPAFLSNGRLYLLYVVDPIQGQPDEDAQTVTFGRVSRFTVTGNVADPASRRVLLGNTAANGFIHCHSSHSIGSIRMGLDGSLFVGSGDGAHFDFTDGGQDVTGFDAGCATTFGSDNDLGALRSQDPDSFAGKILRIDAETGLGLTDNPFWDGNADSVRSKTWVTGLRNPYRFTVRPDSPLPGTLYIGDVGWNAWEELNVATGGENFGWPCFEGPGPEGSYQSSSRTGPACDDLSASEVTAPLIAWHHGDPGSLGFIGNCASGAAFYTSASYPSKYRGACFFADYGRNWIRVATVDAADQLGGIEEFAVGDELGRPVDLEADPMTGDILYVSISAGEVRRFVYTVGNRAPTVVIAAAPLAGPAPLTVQFSSAGTSDPDGDPVSLEWNFGDGSPLNTTPAPSHIYTSGGTFTATLTARDGRGGSTVRSVMIDAGNTPPTVEITSPPADTRFYGGETYDLDGTASDAETSGDDLVWFWSVTLHHEDHTHPEWFTSEERSPSFQAVSHGSSSEEFYYDIELRVTDGGGLAGTAGQELRPGNVLRGDGNADGIVDLSDAVSTLLYLFAGEAPGCALAMDTDANEDLDISDPIALLQFLFAGGPPPSAPYPQCDVAANRAALPCALGCAP